MLARGYPARLFRALFLAALLSACTGTVPPSLVPASDPPSGTDRHTASPGPSATPTTVPTVPISPLPTPAHTPQAGWIRLADAPEAGAAWSSDGQHLLVWTAAPGGPPETNVVRLVTRSGEQVREFEAVTDPVWLDSLRFVLYRLDWRQDEGGEWYAETGPNGERLGSVLAGALGSSELSPLTMPIDPALPNGRGVLALARFDSGDRAEYALWSDGAMSDWRPGYPTTWSHAGDRLLLVHSRDFGPGAEGWLEVAGSDGTTIWSDESVRVGGGLFDPTGFYLAYPEFVERPRLPREVPMFDLVVRIVDLATGAVDGFPAQENGAFAWTSDGNLVVVGFESQQATVYDRAGDALSTAAVLGPTIVASEDGSTLLIYDAELDEPPMQIQRGGALSLLDTPGTLAGPAPDLSPDGSGLVAVVRLPSSAPQGPPATVLLHNL